MSLRYVITTYFSSYVLALILTFTLMGFEADSTLTALIGNLLYLIAFVIMTLTLEKRNFIDFARTKPSFVLQLFPWHAWALIVVPLGVALRIGSGGIFVIFEHGAAIIEFKELMDTNYEKVGDLTAFGIIAMLVAASTEEFIDRRVLFPLLTQRVGIVAGAIIAGTVFGLMHLGYEAIFQGIVLSMIYVISGRIWVCVAVHMTGNLFFPLARILHLRTDWVIYQATSIAMASLLLLMTIWMLVVARRRATQPARETLPFGPL